MIYRNKDGYLVRIFLYCWIVYKNLVIVRAEQGVKVAGWDPNGFWGVGVRWGVGWLKLTRGGVPLAPAKGG